MRVPNQNRASTLTRRESCLRADFPAVLACTVLALFCSCGAPPRAQPADAAAEAERTQALVEQGVDARLAEMFPQARPPYSADSLRSTLLGGVLVAQGEEEQLIAWVRAGEYEKARELLARRLAQVDWDAARRSVEAGDARSALARYDLALERSPREGIVPLAPQPPKHATTTSDPPSSCPPAVF